MNKKNYPSFVSVFKQKPRAYALIRGNEFYEELKGEVWFFETRIGVIVVTEVEGLPENKDGTSNIFAFHIHEGGSCSGDSDDPFRNALTHYNPDNKPHPYHAGDLPPIFSAGGKSFSAVLTNRFGVNEIIGKTIIIHSSVDDFTSQPAGNSGRKIACGEIRLY